MVESTSQRVYPVLPLWLSVLFPSQVIPLSVSRRRSLAAVEAALASEDKMVLIVTQRNSETEEPKLNDLFSVGTLAVIKRMQRVGDMIQAVVLGTARMRIVHDASIEPYLAAEAELLPEPGDTSPETEALFREVVSLSSSIVNVLQPEPPVDMAQLAIQIGKPIRYVYHLASMFSLGLKKEQALLETNSQSEALRIVHDFLSHESQVVQLRKQIASQVETEMSKQQRDYVLRQQLKAIQKELGEETAGDGEAAELNRRADEAHLPDAVRTEVGREISRLSRMSPAAADYQLTRTYIDLALELPWNKSTTDRIDLQSARSVLDEDHFDLNDIKDRILEHLAVMKLNPGAKAPILCFTGPPGVGKTSLGQSIARTLGRKFERMSLGGLHDEAELRGHRRTYVGAMPGRIIQAVRRAGVRNPLIMLDEVDKLGQDYRGDPASALMEILDPAQNASFRDNYLDLPFDLSNVFFITTANSLDSISAPLLDRMEVLQLSGYSEEDKLQIARRYLIPRQLSQAGLSADQLQIEDRAVKAIIERYTWEAGVRELERMFGRIARKFAKRIAERSDAAFEAKFAVDEPELGELLGAERFFVEKARRESRPGVAAGLAWTEAGGEILYVETVRLPNGHGMMMTGQLGHVMKESARAARSYIRSNADSLRIDPQLFADAGIHIHVPAGAVPKDGPSAGVAIAAALASVYSGHPVRNDTAMTGEITLTGLVLPVGGVREKVLAARRAGLNRVIVPRANEKDLDELPEFVRHDMEFVLVENVDEALIAAIPQFSPRHEPQAA